jgi:Sugar transferases involved in lipopolysaccharide synthesis
MMKRLLDIMLVVVAAVVLVIPFAIVAFLVAVTSPGPVLYWSRRVGRDNALFDMPKLRTMRVDTPTVATHLLADAGSYVTPIGRVARKYSLDEIPQLWSVLVGRMSIVGPRPALFNQYDLIELRTQRGIHSLRPGLTGLAQVYGRDSISIPEKVELDAQYLRDQSMMLDWKIIVLTFARVVSSDGVSH